MSVSKNSVFPLTSLPYMIQSRFMEILPYFVQIELAQTNQQFLKIYNNRCRKRSISDSVKIVVDFNGIYVNDLRHRYSLFMNKRSIKTCFKGNHFPTKFLSISTVGKVVWVNIGTLAKDLMENGLDFIDKKQQQSAAKWMASDIRRTIQLSKIEIGWQRLEKITGELTNKVCLTYFRESKNGAISANLSYFM